MPLAYWAIMFFCFGACVGSFLNVVIYRLPAGEGLISPGSHCPKCQHKLAWYDNLPILGWLLLRARCRYCKTSISVQYPLVELLTALLYVGLFWAYYVQPDIRPVIHEAGFEATWPMFVVHLVLISGLLAATVIDGRLFIIPLQIPWFVTVVAALLLPGSVWLGWQVAEPGLTPLMPAKGIGAAIGGLMGLAGALGLLLMRVLPRSFEELAEAVSEDAPAGEIPEHPHPRREVLKEMLFLGLPVLCAALGWWLTPAEATFGGAEAVPEAVRVAGGVAMGYLVGGGIVWLTRILGTLAFGREAMGLGDVHLLAAVGAVIGAGESVLAFFIAPFAGLAAVAVLSAVAAAKREQVRVIPYGPYLAAGAAVVLLLREWLIEFFVMV